MDKGRSTGKFLDFESVDLAIFVLCFDQDIQACGDVGGRPIIKKPMPSIAAEAKTIVRRSRSATTSSELRMLAAFGASFIVYYFPKSQLRCT